MKIATSVPLRERRAHPLGWLDGDPNDRTIRNQARTRLLGAPLRPPADDVEPMCRRDCSTCWSQLVHEVGHYAAQATRDAMPWPPSDTRDHARRHGN